MSSTTGLPTGMVVSVTGHTAVMVNEADRFYGWAFYRHPDGQWVTLRKALPEEIAEAKHNLALQTLLDGAEENDGTTCRMCGDEPDERSACPECGACWECASDDCGICVDRIAYKVAETKKIAEREKNGDPR